MGKKWNKSEKKLLVNLVDKYREKGLKNTNIIPKLKYDFPHRSEKSIGVKVTELRPARGKTKANRVVKKSKVKGTINHLGKSIRKVESLIRRRKEYILKISMIDAKLSKLLKR